MSSIAYRALVAHKRDLAQHGSQREYLVPFKLAHGPRASQLPGRTVSQAPGPSALATKLVLPQKEMAKQQGYLATCQISSMRDKRLRTIALLFSLASGCAKSEFRENTPCWNNR